MGKERHKATGVLGLAINKNCEFLITQRNEPGDPSVHEQWQVPGGGIEFGEQPEETLDREMMEELNVKPIIIFPYPMCKTHVYNHEDHDSSVTLLCYIITIGSQIPRIGDPETLDYQWIHQSKLYRLKYLPLTGLFIDEATRMCNRYGLWNMVQ